jgi:hypothetical protein
MESTVIFYPGMDIDPADFNNLQAGVKQTFDDLVGDTVSPNQKYAGFTVAKTSTTGVTVAPGRLYSGGIQYAQTAPTTQDFLATLPVAGQKIVSVLLLGSVQQGNVTEREFLINQDTGQSQPQAVALTSLRVANVSFAYGNETSTASAPLIQAGYTKIADILLTTTGVAAITMYSPNAMQSNDALDVRVTALETFEAQIAPEVTTIASGLAALANKLSNTTSQATITQMLLAIGTLDAKVGIPTTSAASSCDYLLDGSNSDLANPLSNCIVSEGIRFPWANIQTSVLNLFNPFETHGVVKGGTLLPAYTRYKRQSTGPQTSSVSANSYTYNTVNYAQQTTTSTRTRYGTAFTVCSNSAFWGSGTYNPLTSIFTLPDGETYKASVDINATLAQQQAAGIDNTHLYVRLQEYWTDTVASTYWGAVVSAPQTLPGFHMFESVLVGQDQWIDAVGINLGSLDSQGDITLVICDANDNATPEPSLVIGTVTVPYANLKAGVENVFSLTTPILLSAGQKVSYGIVTTGAHQIATTDGVNFPQGTFFALSPSGFASGDLTKHLCMSFYGCQFTNSTVSIQLSNLQLAGGMSAIDIQAPTIAPTSTSLIYEIQLNGVWVPLNATTVSQLNAGGTLPALVPLRATFTGTPDMMPALGLSASIATVSLPAKALAHVWPKLPRTPTVPSATIGVIERYESFNAAYHSAGVKLLTGAGYTTQTAPSSMTTVTTPDGGVEVTYLFNLGAAVSSWKVLTVATTTSALIPFHGAWIKDYCL